LDSVTIDGHTPLYVAADSGNVQTLKLLITHKADLNQGSNNNQTPAYTAAAKGELEILKILIDANADINLPTRNGQTPAYAAVSNQELKSLELLIENKADLNLTTKLGWTISHVAASLGDANALQLLITHNVDINQRVAGETPLDVAVRKKKGLCVRLLHEVKKKARSVETTNQRPTIPLRIPPPSPTKKPPTVPLTPTSASFSGRQRSQTVGSGERPNLPSRLPPKSPRSPKLNVSLPDVNENSTIMEIKKAPPSRRPPPSPVHKSSTESGKTSTPAFLQRNRAQSDGDLMKPRAPPPSRAPPASPRKASIESDSSGIASPHQASLSPNLLSIDETLF